jgi:hypothetical protein
MGLIQEVLKTMNTELKRIEICLQRLTEEQVWLRFKPEMNSVGNLCVHLAGNEYQHFVSGVGQRHNIRERSMEFAAEGGYSKVELIGLLHDTRNASAQIL